MFGRKNKQVEEKPTKLNQSPVQEKEFNHSSKYPDEKIALNNDQLYDEPDSAASTMLPAYRENESTSSKMTGTDSRSRALSSVGDPKLGPDLNPVTSHIVIPDDGKEVYMPSNDSPTSSRAAPDRQASRSYREYNFYYTNAMTHLIICDPDQKALFFAEMSPFAKGMPDVSLREILGGGFDDLARKGSSLGLKEAQSAPVTAVADAVPNSKHIKAGFGDPFQPESQKWTMMRNVHDDPKTLSERFDVVFKNAVGREETYSWVRGAADDTGDKANSKELFRMLSNTGLVASFRTTSVTTIKKRGVLRVYDVSEADDTLVFTFLTCAALCEKERRRKVKKSFFLGMSSKKG